MDGLKKHFTVEIPNLTLRFLFSFKTPLIQKQPHPVCFFFVFSFHSTPCFVCVWGLAPSVSYTVGIGARLCQHEKALKH